MNLDDTLQTHTMYHIPVGNRWDPKAVCEMLRSHCVNASIVGESVRIKLPDGEPQTILARVLEFLSLRRSKYVLLTFNPTKFIRNVHLEGVWPQTRTELRCFDDIDSAMLKLGYSMGGDREIAARYCPESKTLASLFDEMDRLKEQEEYSVLQQDFENAVLRHDEEEMIAKQIDALLFASVGK